MSSRRTSDVHGAAVARLTAIACAACVCLFALRAGFLVWAVPPWQHPDEPTYLYPIRALTHDPVSGLAGPEHNPSERELIRSRTSEGRERAKARGVRLGRKPKLTDRQRLEAIRRRDHGDETLAEIGRSYHVSGWTIARLQT